MGPCHQFNWTTSHYKTNKLKAFISFVAVPNGEDVKHLYALTVSDLDNLEIHQEDYENLEGALSALNLRYKHWNFIDMSQKTAKDGDGCSSCAAH